jgi:hypothetical protein
LATFQHPASLNPFQQFRQACSILRNTSRASNPAWYQDALELDFQLHIRPDGPGIATFYFDRKHDTWSGGPSLSEEIISDSARLGAVIAEILKTTRSKGAVSLGLVLHIADEFATTELKPELDNPGAIPDLRYAAVNDPASILDDSSIIASQASWRVLPYPAGGSEVIGTTVTLSRQHSDLLAALRDAGERQNFPIITQALSAPLVAIMGLCQTVKPTPEKPFVAILQYSWFTVLAFFNEHSDLRLVRTLQHRGVRRVGNLRNALNTTNASLEFLDPDLFLIPLGESVDTTLEATLHTGFPNSRVEIIQTPAPAGIPAWCPEPCISVNPAALPNPAVSSHTFTILREEKWALQDFLPTPREIVEIYPSRSEMRLLRVLRLSRVALFAITVICLAYFVLGAVDLVRRPEWAFNPTEADAIKKRLGMLTSAQQKVDHWANLLQDRSKAWTAMESLSRMFPENGGMLVKNFNHSVKPDNTPGQAKTGFVKEWKITGYARDEALEYLNTLNTREGISAHFSEIARATANPAYDPGTGNRSITVNVRTQENPAFKPTPPEESIVSDESTYPFTFDLTITQRFEATDPLAVNVPKAP